MNPKKPIEKNLPKKNSNISSKGQLWSFVGAFVLIILVVLLINTLQTDQTLPNILGLNKDFSGIVKKSKKPTNLNLEQATVTHVTDGDTIKLSDGRTVRYLNIDTPETKKPNTPVKCFGPQASETNKKLVENKQIWLKADKEDVDRYDRSLRFVFLNKEDSGDIEKSVNAILVKNGLAKSVSYKPNVTYKTTFDRLTQEAQTQKIGLWKACPKPFEE
jgi:micrococcal nuclease